MKKEFICVQPRSTTAKQDFVEYMNELHSCVVTKREHGMLVYHQYQVNMTLKCLRVATTIGRLSNERPSLSWGRNTSYQIL